MRLLPNPKHFPPIDWQLAQRLPVYVQAAWRTAERWRRLYEQAAAGNDIFVLEELIEPAVLIDFLGQLDTWQDYQSSVVVAQRALIVDGPVFELMQHTVFRQLVQTILHVPLSSSLWLQAWGLTKGQSIKVHSDGAKYLGTLTVGCSMGWTAQDGGALCFGSPHKRGWRNRFRCLPQLSSALLFRPRADLWHGVEEVQRNRRLTITGWWLES